MNVLKSGDVVYRCSKSKSCKKSITTDKDGIFVVKTRNDHTCNMESDKRKSEAQILRVRVRKAYGDISKRPSTLIRSALQTSTENNSLFCLDIFPLITYLSLLPPSLPNSLYSIINIYTEKELIHINMVDLT